MLITSISKQRFSQVKVCWRNPPSLIRPWSATAGMAALFVLLWDGSRRKSQNSWLCFSPSWFHCGDNNSVRWKTQLWKLRQVVCLVIIRHVIFTSSPPVVGSCTWLIRTVHSQLVVLRCRARRLAVQAHLHTRCLFTHQHTPLGFHIYFAFLFFFPALMLVSTYLFASVLPVCFTCLWESLCKCTMWLRRG